MDTGFDDVRYHLYVVGAVAAQPHFDDGDDALYIIGDVVGAMGGRDLKARQNRGEDSFLQFSVPDVGADAAWIAKRCPVYLFIVPNEMQVGQQIGPADQNQLCLIPAVQNLRLLLGEIGEKPPVNHLHRLIQQVADGFIVEVEGGAVHPGRLAELLHGDVLQIFPLQEGQEGFLHPQGGMEIFAFGFVHLPPSSRGYSAPSLISWAS